MNNENLQSQNLRKNDPLTDAEVLQLRDCLKTHPDFFESNEDLLEDISLPHESGKAVSLIERQVAVLRQRNLEMRQQINAVVEAAKDNDKLFDKSKRLVLSLLEAGDLNTLVETLNDSLRNDYQIEYFSLTLIGDQPLQTKAKTVTQEQARRQIAPILNSSRAICGILRQKEMAFLFGRQAGEIGSVAVIPISHGNTLGVLAVGNRNPQYYTGSTGTLFLSYIADVLNRLLPKYMG